MQTFQYDSLNRITVAKEINSGTTTWQQAWNYDRFGNRTSFNSSAIGQTAITTTPNIDQNTNRFVAGVQYDKTGNIIQDSVNGQLRNFVFNGDNKQVHVKDANNQPIGTYFYDGNGARVKKSTASETTIFVYDASSKLVAEYSTATPPTTPTISYTATDTLGSPRVITDKQGNVTSRRDFMPFGEELNPDANYRKPNFKYGSTTDNIRKRFTGYEKDEETGLDFAQARYYNNIHGRFTAVDPLLASGKSGNPQSFNRYAYTMNQPLSMIDPTGLQSQTVARKDSLGDVTTYINDAVERSAEWADKYVKKASEWINREFSYGGDTVKFGERIPLADKILNSDPLARYQGERFQSMMDNGGLQESQKMFAFKGASVNNIADQTADSYFKAANIGLAGIELQGAIFTMAAGAGSGSGMASARGFTVPGGGFSAGTSTLGRTPLSVESIIQKAANIAERRIGGTGAVNGTFKHSYAEKLINRYQSIFGDRGLVTERSFLNGQQVTYGTRGSVRPDVFDINTRNVFDFKFTTRPPGLTTNQINRFTFNIPRVNQVSAINPQ